VRENYYVDSKTNVNYLDQLDSQDVAIEKFTIFEFEREEVITQIKQAIQNMKNLNHENIVKYLDCNESECGIDIILQQCKGGNLFTILHDQRNNLTIGFCMKILLEIAEGMEYLHDNDILHNDLRSKNVFLYDNSIPRAMIANYGIKTKFNTESHRISQEELMRYNAPEVFSNGRYSKQSDVYAYGILMWEVFTRCIPFEGMGLEEIVSYINDNGRPDIKLLDPETPPIITYILIKCWEEGVDRRAGFSDIVQQLKKYFD
jgi:serine/threonine protein kinase